MTDDFMRDAGAAWRREPGDVGAVHLRLRRTRWAPHVVLTLEVSGALAAFGVGVAYFFLAQTTHQLIFVLSAVALLAGMPLTIDATLRARRTSLKWEDETPRSVIDTALRRARASLQAIRLGWRGIAAIAGFVVLLWGVQALGLLRPAWFAPIYTGVAVIICAPYALYLRYRDRRVRQEQAACVRLLQDFDQAEALGE